MTRLFVLLTLVPALLLSCQGEPDARSSRPAPVTVRDSIRARREARLQLMPDTLGTRVDSARVLGSPQARVWVVVVSDFQCEPCRALALDVLPAVRREFVETGRARLAFMNLPQDTHFNARFAAHAALCAAAAGRFWAMHDSVFATQPRWQRLDDPRPFLDSVAIAAGVPTTRQTSCTARQPLLRLLSEDIERSRASGTTDVPTVFVGAQRLTRGDLTLAAIRRAIEAAPRR